MPERMRMALLPESLDDLISTSEAAEACNVTGTAIRNWVTRGYLTPTGLDNDNRPLYKLIDVLRAERDTRRRALKGRASHG